MVTTRPPPSNPPPPPMVGMNAWSSSGVMGEKGRRPVLLAARDEPGAFLRSAVSGVAGTVDGGMLLWKSHDGSRGGASFTRAGAGGWGGATGGSVQTLCAKRREVYKL